MEERETDAKMERRVPTRHGRKGDRQQDGQTRANETWKKGRPTTRWTDACQRDMEERETDTDNKVDRRVPTSHGRKGDRHRQQGGQTRANETWKKGRPTPTTRWTDACQLAMEERETDNKMDRRVPTSHGRKGDRQQDGQTRAN